MRCLFGAAFESRGQFGNSCIFCNDIVGVFGTCVFSAISTQFFWRARRRARALLKKQKEKKGKTFAHNGGENKCTRARGKTEVRQPQCLSLTVDGCYPSPFSCFIIITFVIFHTFPFFRLLRSIYITTAVSFCFFYTIANPISTKNTHTLTQLARVRTSSRRFSPFPRVLRQIRAKNDC